MDRPVRVRAFGGCGQIKAEHRGDNRDQANGLDGTHTSLPDTSSQSTTTSLERCFVLLARRQFDLRVPSTAGNERSNAAGEAENTRAAFALDLFGAETK